MKRLFPALRALLAMALVIAVGEVIFRRFLVPALGVSLTDTPDFTQWPGMLILGFLLPVVMVTVALLLYRFVDRRKWSDFGFDMSDRARVVAFGGLALMLISFGFFIAFTQMAESIEWRITSGVSWIFVLSAAVTYIGTGVWEEFFFRGYLYRTLTDYGKPAAYIVSILLFSLIHFTEESLELSRLLNLLLTSFFLTYVYDRTRSIWPGVLLHGSWNFFNFLVVSNQSGVSVLQVTGPISLYNRWFSTILHLVLIFLVWIIYRNRSMGSKLKKEMHT
ncbi:MAG TPA: CPBP family intramembrane glutamic endopeptidase [Proteiniclasticum sp.]|nr:CPBP family intramembrane glutamic endopeptidase [Proteiniclasticum sp.]